MRVPVVAAALLLSSLPLIAQSTVSGEAVYQEHCASCHDARAPRAAANVLRELETGAMASIGSQLSRAQREAVAAFLSAPKLTESAEGMCPDRTVRMDAAGPSVWNGWSPSPANTRFQPTSAAGLTLNHIPQLKLKWAFGFERDVIVFAQPSVSGNNLFVGSASGKVHALDTRTGCSHWTFQAETGVRSAIVIARVGNRNALLFGDRAGWFYSLDADNGKVLWKKKVDDHAGARMTGAAVVNDGVVYIPVSSVEETLARGEKYECCTFRGSIVALRLADGSQVWKTYMIAEVPRKLSANAWGPSGAAVWATPTLDLKRGLLYAATGDNYSEPDTPMSDAIVAVDLKTGKVAWSHQTIPGDIFNGNCQVKNTCPGMDYDFGASVILEQAGGRDVLLAGQKSGMVFALDPDRQGRELWQARVGKGGVNGGVQWGMASDGRNLYAATSDVVRRDRAGYDPTQGGGLTALRVADGAKAWFTAPPACDQKPGCSPAQSSAVTAIPGVVFSGSLDGHLRAYSSENGKVIWDFDTARAFPTVNGVKASGGGVDGPGAVVTGGMVFVGSGYQRTGGMGGNILLAFGTE